MAEFEQEDAHELRLDANDVALDVTENTEGMDEEMSDGELDMDPEETFQDDSIAAFYGHRKSVFCVQLHPSFPNPPIAVSGGEDDGGWIWNTIDGSEITRLSGHTDSVVAVSFSNDGEFVATGGLDGRVRVWRRHGSEWATWEFLTSLDGPSEVVWLSWHPKGPVLAAGASDTTVWMWQLPSGNVMNVFSGHTGSVTCGRFTPDGRKLVTGSDDGSLIVWDPRSAAALAKFDGGDQRFELPGGITSLTVSPDSRVIAAGGAAGGIRVVSIANVDNGDGGSFVGALDGHNDGESVESIEFISLAGSTAHIVSAGTDGRAIIWDLHAGRQRGEVAHDAAITKLVVHPNTPMFTTSSIDHTIRTWDARNAKQVGEQHGFTDGVLDVAVGVDDGLTQGAESGGIGAFVDISQSKGFKIVGAGDEGVALVFRLM
ncbi:60S ribosomal subunit assembly or modification protein [Malassezia cuniculi]|uniref:60S ribosomal subunit assembly or modification protein n=1 Tax=Malassezia cuniculi TaxID=948313 RepID=A0AAF0ESZ4_9BASI|nr:60S ribosomal subunit assembly or modification protein [Malassezia cuniculi]